MASSTSGSLRRRRLVRAAAILGGLFILYTSLGFLAAPLVLRKVLVEKASAALSRPVTVERVRVNPLALSVSIAGLSIRERDGSPFVSWDLLYVRAAPLRIFTGDVGLAEIRLVHPALHGGLLADGALSFQDLLGPSSAPAPSSPAAPEGRGSLGLSIGQLAIEDAQVTFRDATRRPAFESVIGPLTIRLESFRTKGGGDSPYSFTGVTDAGETFRWTGTVRTQPIRSAGTLTFEKIALPRYEPYLRDATPAELRSGILDLDMRYELEWGARHVLRLAGGRAVVTELALAPRGEADAPVRLPRLEVSGVEVDAVARQATVAEVALRGGALRVRREADGTLELMRLAPPAREAPPPPSAAPWAWSVGALAISGVALTWEDRVPPVPVTLPLTDMAVRLEQLRPGAASTSPLSVSFGWPSGGRVEVTGNVLPFGAQAKLDLQATGLDLVPLEPYLQPDLAARLTSGRAGAKAQVSFDGSQAEPRWSFLGDVRLDGLALSERGNADLFRWKALEVNGLDVGSTPPHASVRLVRLLEPRARLYMWEDGTTSLSRARGAPPAAAPASPAAPPRGGAAAPEWKTAIGAVEVVGGRATFLDRSVTPPAVVNLTRATARLAKLSSDPRVRSTADVLLEVEGASPIHVTGTLNPLQTGAYTDLAVSSQGVDLTPLGPYAGKYLGYGLQKGKLDLDLRYRIEDRILSSTNVVRVNQLTLGEATKSPDAMKVPVRLALALLQDREGVILLDVPVEGKLDDPEFRLGKVIWRTLLNVLVKVATSPFRALAALAGGDQQELSVVEFAPGTADLVPDSRQRLTLLAKSLAQRPVLGLEVEGSADEVRDGDALRRAAVESALRHAKALTLKPPPESEDEVALSPGERLRFLRAAHAAAFPAAPAASADGARKDAGKKDAAPEPTAEELEDQLATVAEVNADAYATLATDRAQRARDALIAEGIDQARLFLTRGGERATKEKGARAYFEVK